MDDKFLRSIEPGDFVVANSESFLTYSGGTGLDYAVVGGIDANYVTLFFLESGRRHRADRSTKKILKTPKSAVPKYLYSEKNPKWQQLLDLGIGIYVRKS